MKPARDDDDDDAMGGNESRRRSYDPHHREHNDDDDQEEEEQEQTTGRAIACDVLLSLSLQSCWSSCSSPSTSYTHRIQADQQAASSGTAAPPLKRRRRRRGLVDDVFECQTCGRRFPTFQALGGHRTSHLRRPAATRKPRLKAVHACAMCGLGFSTGQALGGHMRRHRRLGRDDDGMGCHSGDVDLTQIIVHGRPTSTSSSLQLLNLFV